MVKRLTDKEADTIIALAQMSDFNQQAFSDYLDQNRALLNARDKENKTLLHLVVRRAATYGNDRSLLEKIEVLLRLGADINAKDKLGRTPLHIAAQYGDAELLNRNFHTLVTHAVEHGFDFNYRDNSGSTVLQHICDKEYPVRSNPLASQLLASVANMNVNTVNKSGFTPLLDSWFSKRYDEVLTLIVHGADPQKTTHPRLAERSDSAPVRVRTNLFQLLANKISEKQSIGDIARVAELTHLNENIILRRLVFLSQQALTDYKESRSTLNPQRQATITQLETCLAAIPEVLAETDDPKVQIGNLFHTLTECANAAADDHKKHGTFMFFGRGLTSSTLASKLQKLTQHSILSAIEIPPRQTAAQAGLI